MRKNKLIYISSFVFLNIFLLNSCGTSIALEEFKRIEIEKSKFMPSTEELQNSSKPKVLLLNFDTKNIQTAINASLDSSIATALASKLSSENVVQIVKRVSNKSQADILQEEIKAKESSTELGTDVGQADYIISGEISNATYSSQFSEGYTIIIDGRKIPISPKFNYTSCVDGIVQILALPNLNIEKTVPFHECASREVDTRNASNPILRDDGLVREAGDESAEASSFEVLNFFAKRGYIFEMRTNSSDSIINTTISAVDGVKEGDEVEIFATETFTNPLTNKSSTEDIKIGNGVVTNQFTSSSAWIKIEKLEENRKIKIGDYIKIKYSEGFLKKALKLL